MSDATQYGQVSEITEDRSGDRDFRIEHGIFAEEFENARLVERVIFPEAVTLRDGETLEIYVDVPLN